jgi:hypothetical protein
MIMLCPTTLHVISCVTSFKLVIDRFLICVDFNFMALL